VRKQHRIKLNDSTNAEDATAAAFSAMVTAIWILPTASLMHGACLLESVPLVEGLATSLK
jgi:hypothetical protein